VRAKEKAHEATGIGTAFTLECWHIEDYTYNPSSAATSRVASDAYVAKELVRQVSSSFDAGTTEL